MECGDRQGGITINQLPDPITGFRLGVNRGKRGTPSPKHGHDSETTSNSGAVVPPAQRPDGTIVG